MHSGSWTVLGSSSGIPSLERACAGHLLESNDRFILFDCGSGVTSSLLRHGFNPEKVESIIISHTHADHISDLPLFLQLLHQEKRTAGLDVYLPSDAIAQIGGYLDAAYLFKEKLPFPMQLKPITENMTFFKGAIIVDSIMNNHLKSNEKIIIESGYPNRMQAYSFLVRYEEGVRIFYTADIGTLEDIENYIEGIDLLVVESTHTAFSALLQLLEERHPKNAILSHMSDDVLRQLKSSIDRTTIRAKIMVAEDGFTFRF
jgi:ribonuclease BN (tRNA processing enzyme)